MPPRNFDGFIEEPRCEDDGKMGEAHSDFVLGDGDVGRHVDEIYTQQRQIWAARDRIQGPLGLACATKRAERT